MKNYNVICAAGKKTPGMRQERRETAAYKWEQTRGKDENYRDWRERYFGKSSLHGTIPAARNRSGGTKERRVSGRHARAAKPEIRFSKDREGGRNRLHGRQRALRSVGRNDTRKVCYRAARQVDGSGEYGPCRPGIS